MNRYRAAWFVVALALMVLASALGIDTGAATVPAADDDLELIETLSEHSEWCDEANRARYGRSLAMGDVDGNGLDDIVVAAEGDYEIYVHYGLSGGTYWEPSSTHAFGDVTVADLDGDGQSDVVAGYRGEVRVLWGGDDREQFGLQPPPSVAEISDTPLIETLVAALGDHNGDGRDDIVAALPSEGTAFALYGTPGMSTGQAPGGPPGLLEPVPVPYEQFTWARGNAGDVNNDGFDDLIGTLPGSGGGEPQAAVALGPPDRVLRSAGANGDGQLGDGTAIERHNLVDAGSAGPWSVLSCGEVHCAALRADGTLWTWGGNYRGQLGDGGVAYSAPNPTQVGTRTDWIAVAAGATHTLAVRRDGTLWAWGDNTNGQLGNNSTMEAYAPVRVGNTSNWAMVTGGYRHSLALKRNGSLWAWGLNSDGQLGLGSTTEHHSPQRVGAATDWTAVDAGGQHTLGIRSDGSLWAWGDCTTGQLGLGFKADRDEPAQIGTDTDWWQVAGGWRHSLALKTDGTAWAWGHNMQGQAGDGTANERLAPVAVIGDHRWLAISAGDHHNWAITPDGELWGWGFNNHGQLGDGTTSSRYAPVPIDTDHEWVTAGLGGEHSVAARSVPLVERHDWSVSGIPGTTSPRFAEVVGGAGNINGDDYADIVVTDPGHDGKPDEPGHYGYWGRVYIWLGDQPGEGNPTGLGTSDTPLRADVVKDGGPANGAERTLAHGDVNGDGCGDLAVGDYRGADWCFEDDGVTQGIVETGIVQLYRSTFCGPDTDGDGVPDDDDNCDNVPNPGQSNRDNDPHGDACDNCPGAYNEGQEDSDGDGPGDACDACPHEAPDDGDGDGYCAGEGFQPPMAGDNDNCPEVTNVDQADWDGNGVGDVCDDWDGDGTVDAEDNCLKIRSGQDDADGDGLGDVCDNCWDVPNAAAQEDGDGDGVGDVCDNCPTTPNGRSPIPGVCVTGDLGKVCWQNWDCGERASCSPAPKAGTCTEGHVGSVCAADGACGPGGLCSMSQEDSDGDGWGDVCDDDDDNDGVLDEEDNCRVVPNGPAAGTCATVPNGCARTNEGAPCQTGNDCGWPGFCSLGQEDTDGDGLGNACNGAVDADGDELADDLDNCPGFCNPDQKDDNGDGLGDACDFDLTISRVEITQAVQDEQNSVPLIAGKDTWIRVYFDVGMAGKAMGPISGTIRFEYENGLPMYTFINGVATDLTVFAEHTIVAPPAPDPEVLSDTLIFLIPGHWGWDATPYVDLTFHYTGAPPEVRPWNNWIPSFPLEFRSAPPLNLYYVPGYSCQNLYIEGISPCPPPDKDDFKAAAAWMKRIYPISRIDDRIMPDEFLSYDPTDSDVKGGAYWSYLGLLNTLNNDELDNMKYFSFVCDELEPTTTTFLTGNGAIGMGWGDEAWGIRQDSTDYTKTVTGYKWYTNTQEILGGEMMAHELGHVLLGNLGFGWTDLGYTEPWPGHVRDNCGAHEPFFEDYPPPDSVRKHRGLIDAWGFDGERAYSPTKYYDIMTYSPCTGPSGIAPGKGRWISAYTYKALISHPPDVVASARTPRRAEIPYLAASGIISPDGSVDSLTLYQVMLPTESDDEPGDGRYSLELQAEDSQVLFARHFMPGGPIESERNQRAVVFSEILPYHPDTRSILVKEGDQVLHTTSVSAHAPQVRVTYPNGGESLSGPVTVTWTASDADGDPLTFGVQYSTDGGETWSLVTLGLEEREFTWNTAAWAGSDQALIRVLANDGVLTGQDESDAPFSVPFKGPDVGILAPQDQALFFLDENIRFEGWGDDLEDGNPTDEHLTWSSSLDGELGWGPEQVRRDLSPGAHTITLAVEDGDGNQASAQMTITVLDDKDSDGDSVADGDDNCPLAWNANQADGDGDGAGDACDDDDDDGDGYPNWADNCPQQANDLADADRDGLGDACDNCPETPNPDQTDRDRDGLGDACDPQGGPTRIYLPLILKDHRPPYSVLGQSNRFRGLYLDDTGDVDTEVVVA